MTAKTFFATITLLFSTQTQAVTECPAKIASYFIGTSLVDQKVAHLWVKLDGGGTASISSESAAFSGILSTTLASLAADKAVTLRYFSDNADCKAHNGDWVGIWLQK